MGLGQRNLLRRILFLHELCALCEHHFHVGCSIQNLVPDGRLDFWLAWCRVHKYNWISNTKHRLGPRLMYKSKLRFKLKLWRWFWVSRSVSRRKWQVRSSYLAIHSQEGARRYNRWNNRPYWKGQSSSSWVRWCYTTWLIYNIWDHHRRCSWEGNLSWAHSCNCNVTVILMWL